MTGKVDDYNADLSMQPPKLEKKPRPGSAGAGRAVFWALAAILMVGSLAWWFFQSEEGKDALRREAADRINGVLRETPFAGMGDLLLKTPPPPPAQVVSPPTNPGTLSGRQIEGTIGAPAELDRPDAGNEQFDQDGITAAGETAAQPELAEPLTEDKSVPPAYIAALAGWLAGHYQPASGRLGVTAQTLNQYGGVTLAGQARGGRAGFLRYAFQPSMLQGLYKLYIDRFMEDLNEAAKNKGFSDAQNRQFHMALAGKAVLWAAGLEGVLKLPDLRGSLRKIDDLAQKTVDLNMQLTNAVFELDELREKKASKQQSDTAQMRVDGLAARYRRATEEHAAAQRHLAAQIRQTAGQGLDQETLLFMAAWAERRMAEDGGAALASCVSLLRDLGRRCARIGSNV